MWTKLHVSLGSASGDHALTHAKRFLDVAPSSLNLCKRNTNKVLTTWTRASSLSALSRCHDGSGSVSGNAPLDQKFLLKWSVPLSFVEVLEFGSSEDMADSSHYQTPHSGEKVVINAKPSMNHSVTLSYFESLSITWAHVWSYFWGLIPDNLEIRSGEVILYLKCNVSCWTRSDISKMVSVLHRPSSYWVCIFFPSVIFWWVQSFRWLLSCHRQLLSHFKMTSKRRSESVCFCGHSPAHFWAGECFDSILSLVCQRLCLRIQAEVKGSFFQLPVVAGWNEIHTALFRSLCHCL